MHHILTGNDSSSISNWALLEDKQTDGKNPNSLSPAPKILYSWCYPD